MTSYPTPISEVVPVVHGNYLYVVGGDTNRNTLVTDAYFARLKADGSLGPWTATTPLPSIGPGIGMVAFNNRLYALQMNFNIYRADFKADGSLSEWTPLAGPGHGSYLAVQVFNGYLYVIGGSHVNGQVSSAKLNEDGSLGPWVSLTSLPEYKYTASVHFTADRVYVVGGYNGGGSLLQFTQDRLFWTEPLVNGAKKHRFRFRFGYKVEQQLVTRSLSSAG